MIPCRDIKICKKGAFGRDITLCFDDSFSKNNFVNIKKVRGSILIGISEKDIYKSCFNLFL